MNGAEPMSILSIRGAGSRPRQLRPVAALFLTGLCIADAATAMAQAPNVPVERTRHIESYAAHIVEASKRFGIPERWIRAVMRVESAGKLHAISPKGAMGLMQIMPDTWAELRARHRLGDDPYDPRDNILAGAAYLRELHERYGSPGFLAAYNAGPGRYEAYLRGSPLPAETRAYVATLVGVVDADSVLEPPRMGDRSDGPWRDASLFAVLAERDPETKPQQSDWLPENTRPALSPRNTSVVRPFAGDLFVSRSGTTSWP